MAAGADIHARDSYGWTALHDAAARGHADCVRELLKAGADKHGKDKAELTPIHLAKQNSHHAAHDAMVNPNAGQKAAVNGPAPAKRKRPPKKKKGEAASPSASAYGRRRRVGRRGALHGAAEAEPAAPPASLSTPWSRCRRVVRSRRPRRKGEVDDRPTPSRQRPYPSRLPGITAQSGLSRCLNLTIRGQSERSVFKSHPPRRYMRTICMCIYIYIYGRGVPSVSIR